MASFQSLCKEGAGNNIFLTYRKFSVPRRHLRQRAEIARAEVLVENNGQHLIWDILDSSRLGDLLGDMQLGTLV